MQDDQGPVNYFAANKLEIPMISKDTNFLPIDDSITIPSSLVLRSLPLNFEMLDLIKQKRQRDDPS
jgi:hypothetical protein